MALTTTTSGAGLGNQTSTQTPQASVGPASKAAASGSVQPGTATSLLTQSNGISLSGQALTAVSLDGTTTSTGQSSQPEPVTPAKHDVNPVLLGLAIALFVAALMIVWKINHSAKNTTN